MNNFLWDVETKIYFGQGQIVNLGPEAAHYGKRALLVYGGGSVRRSGVYDAARATLEANGITCFDLPGVEPNPRHTTVAKGASLCREHKLDMVIALGGGSSIDCAKVIAGAVFYDGDPWDLVCGKAAYTRFLPVLTVLTLAATGSEMDAIAVISNMDVNDKIGTRHPDMRPKVSILDPTYTYSVPAYHTAAGTADIFAHVLENYLGTVEDAFVQDVFAEGLMRCCLKYGPLALAQPDNYEARANLMWASSHAINGLLQLGKDHAWSAHTMEHQLSAYYDVTHGAGLAILIPRWLRRVLSPATAPRLSRLAQAVFGITPSGDDQADALAGIDAMARYFFESLRLPATLREVGISDKSAFRAMAEKAAPGLQKNVFVPLSAADVEGILEDCF